MAYELVKVDANSFRAVNKDLQCKEDWIFQAYLLGFKDSPNPAMDFITYVSEKYPSVEFLRRFYNDDQGRFQETCGLEITFSKKQEAQAYADELNV